MLQHVGDVRTFGLAAEMSFWVFLALIPLAAVAGLVAAKLSVHHFAAVAPMFTSLPPEAAAFINAQLRDVAAWNGGAVALPAALVFVWMASSGVHSVFDALEIQTQSTRPWWKKRALAIATCVGLSAGVGLLAVLTTGFDWIMRLLDIPIGDAVAHSRALGLGTRGVVGCLVLFGLNAGLYWVGIPKDRRRQMPIVPGALVSTLLEASLGVGYGVYVSAAGDGGAYQGALAIIGITMTTLYLFSVAVLVGAEVNHFIAARRNGGGIPRKPTGSRIYRPHFPREPHDPAHALAPIPRRSP